MNGYRIELSEIESVMLKASRIHDVALVAEIQKATRQLVAFVIFSTAALGPSKILFDYSEQRNNVKQFLRRLPHYMTNICNSAGDDVYAFL